MVKKTLHKDMIHKFGINVLAEHRNCTINKCIIACYKKFGGEVLDNTT